MNVVSKVAVLHFKPCVNACVMRGEPFSPVAYFITHCDNVENLPPAENDDDAGVQS